MSTFTFPSTYKETLSKLRESHLEQGLILSELERQELFLIEDVSDYFKEGSSTLILLLSQKVFENNHRLQTLIAQLEGKSE